MYTTKRKAASRRRAAPAPPTVGIVVHLERLGPPYDGKDWVHFSLNLTAAFDGTPSADDVRQMLAVWKWQWADVAVLGIDAANRTVSLPGAVELLLSQAPAGPAKLVTELEAEMEAAI